MEVVAARSKFKFPIYFMADIFSKVLPFHMAQGMTAMRGLVNNCDCVIELRDARVPLSSSNPQFGDLYANKPKILIMNKIDLADRTKTKGICEQRLLQKYPHIIYNNSKAQHSKQFAKIMTLLKKMFMNLNEEKAAQQVNKPMKSLYDREYRVMVCGIPNVGKSSFINSARRHFMGKGGKATPVGKKPGVTRSVLGAINVSTSPKIKILDSPGIIPPAVSNPITGIKLSLTGTFPDHKIGEEVIADYLLYQLNKVNNARYLKFCGVTKPTDDFDDVMECVASKYNLYRNGLADYRRCSILFVNAFRDNNFGPVTFDYNDET